VLMGWRNLPNIIDTLIANGKDPSTPVAVTQWGTTPHQRSVSGTLVDVVAKGNEAGLTSPVVTVIGAVAALRERMRWFDTGALSGQRVLVTRSRQQASVLSKLLSAQGATPIELPTIQIEPLDDYSILVPVLSVLPDYDCVLFTSANAGDFVFERLAATGLDARAFGTAKVGAIGPATARSLFDHNIIADYIPGTYTTEAIAQDFANVGILHKRVLLPRADIAANTLPSSLREAGADLDEVEVYHTIVPNDAKTKAYELLTTGHVDAITFTSSSTVRNLVSLIDGEVSLFKGIRVVSIGPVTSATARELGVYVDVEANEHTIPGMINALIETTGSVRTTGKEQATNP